MVGVDANEEVTGRYFVDEFHTSIPDDCDIILPTRDGDLLWVPTVWKCDDVERFNDKWFFADLCTELGIPHPVTRKERERNSDVEKPRGGSGSRVYLTRDALSVEAEMIYQDRMYGPEYSCDAYYTLSGDLHGYVVRRREVIKGGEAWVTTVDTSPHMHAVCGEYLRKFEGMRGPVNMQLINDVVIEVNARVGGAMTASIAAGLDVFRWMIEETRGEQLTPFTLRPVRMRRYPADLIEEGEYEPLRNTGKNRVQAVTV